jgi:hypothetical protein
VGAHDPAVEQTRQGTTSTTRAPTYASELTTTDGHRYQVTLVLGDRTATGAADQCPTPATPGRYVVPVTLTVANLAADRPAPFPPLRVELATAPGTRPGQVMVTDQAGGACTFAPRMPSIAPGATVSFRGTTPPVEEGGGGRVEVKVSESSFTLAAPLP